MSKRERVASIKRTFRIFLIRHGESWEDVDKSIYERIEDASVTLTEKGQDQASSLGDALATKKLSSDVRAFISSGVRSAQTYEIMASKWRDVECRVQEEPLIRKQNWGSFPVSRRESIEEERYRVGVFFYKFPNGESGKDVYDRITRFVDDLEFQYRHTQLPNDVIIVTHGLELRLLLMRLFRWSVEEFEGLAGPANGCCVTILHSGGANYVLEEPYPAYQGAITRAGRSRHASDGISRTR